MLYAKKCALRDRFPSVAWLIERWHEHSSSLAEFHDRHMSMVDGMFLSGDKSYKIVKLCFVRLDSDDGALQGFRLLLYAV